MATPVFKRIAQFVATASEAAYYTTPAGTTAILKQAVVANTTATAQSLGLSVVPAGNVAGNANRIIPNTSIPGNSSVVLDVTTVLAEGDFISAIASVANALTVTISGMEIPGSNGLSTGSAVTVPISWGNPVAVGTATTAGVSTLLARSDHVHQGFWVVTTTTRPASPFIGMRIFETDTLTGRVWDGVAWQLMGPKVPVCRVRATVTEAISGSWKALSFQLIVEDNWPTGNKQFLLTSPTRFTCREAGVYNIEGTVGWANTAGGSRGVGLRKNGTGAAGPDLGTNLAVPNTTWSFKNNAVANGIRLAVGDYVELVAVTTVNANTVIEDGDSHFAWTYVGA